MRVASSRLTGVVCLLAVFALATPVLAEETDLTGEICLDGSRRVDPDGEGPLPSFNYCVMSGTLPPNTAIEIDDIGNDLPVPGFPETVADANLFAGDTANDPDLPVVPGAIYIDWNDLDIDDVFGPEAAPLGSVENHRILDWTANADFTMLRPQAASCLNSGSVLPKEDFTQSYIGNNQDFLYFGQERRTNNGNSVYYWLLTKQAPVVVATGDCGDNTRGQLQFNLTAGDVEILVNFPDSKDPAAGGVFFRSYGGADSGYVPVRDAVFHPQWGGLAPVLNISLNIVGDGDDDYGKWGGIDKQGNPVESGSFTQASLAEWAVGLNLLFDNPVLCGQQLYITALSRASTGQIDSLTEPSALKDVIGPKLYSFGEAEATATLEGSCDFTLGYSGEATSPTGELTDDNATFRWEFFKCVDECDVDNAPGDDLPAGVVEDDAAGPPPFDVASPELGAGQYYAILTVTQDDSVCSDTAISNVAQVAAPLTVVIAPDDEAQTCPLDEADLDDVVYSAAVTGGSGTYDYSWTVMGNNIASPCGNEPTCRVDFADSEFCGEISVQVEVADAEGSCPAVQTDPEVVTKSTTVIATSGD